MSKVSFFKNQIIKNSLALNGGDMSKEFSQSKLMQNEQLKNNDMFFEKNLQKLKIDIQKQTINYIKNISSLLSSIQSMEKTIQKSNDTKTLKASAIALASFAIDFFSSSDDLLKTINTFYKNSEGLLSNKESKKLQNMIKSLSISITMSLSFFRTSKKMILKLGLQSDNYEEFEEDLFRFLDIVKTIQTRISSNVSAFKPEYLKVQLNNESIQVLLGNDLQTICNLRNRFSSYRLSLYHSIKQCSSEIRDGKRNNDKKRNKKIVKVNL